MTTLQKIAGNINSPIPGSVTYQSDVLLNSAIHFIIVNKVLEEGIGINPDYEFDPETGILSRTSPWVLGDKLIIVYSKCNC